VLCETQRTFICRDRSRHRCNKEIANSSRIAITPDALPKPRAPLAISFRFGVTSATARRIIARRTKNEARAQRREFRARICETSHVQDCISNSHYTLPPVPLRRSDLAGDPTSDTRVSARAETRISSSSPEGRNCADLIEDGLWYCRIIIPAVLLVAIVKIRVSRVDPRESIRCIAIERSLSATGKDKPGIAIRHVVLFV